MSRVGEIRGDKSRWAARIETRHLLEPLAREPNVEKRSRGVERSRQRYLRVVAVDGDGGDGDDGIRARAAAAGKPLPRCRTQPRRPPPVADDDGGDAVVALAAVVVGAAAVVAGAVVVVVVVGAAAAAEAAVPERCPRIPATRRRAQGRFLAACPPTTRAQQRTGSRCCAASGRNPRADSRARNCCARSCVRGASPVPASFQPVAPPALVAVPVVHVLLFPSFRERAATRYSFAFLDDDDDDEDDTREDEEKERDNEAEARRLSHMSRRVTRRTERVFTRWTSNKGTRETEKRFGEEGRGGTEVDDI